MTRIEKLNIASALSEYSARCQRAAERAHREHDSTREREMRAEANTAAATLTWWLDIVNAPAGTVTI